MKKCTNLTALSGSIQPSLPWQSKRLPKARIIQSLEPMLPIQLGISENPKQVWKRPWHKLSAEHPEIFGLLDSQESQDQGNIGDLTCRADALVTRSPGITEERMQLSIAFVCLFASNVSLWLRVCFPRACSHAIEAVLLRGYMQPRTLSNTAQL